MNRPVLLEVPYMGGPGIPGDRRADRRYEMELDVRWWVLHRRRVLESGTGKTVDLASGGLSFQAGRDLPPGARLELAVSWPVLLHNVAPMQLVVSGRVVRSENGRVSVRMEQHEFRTSAARRVLSTPGSTAAVLPFRRATGTAVMR